MIILNHWPKEKRFCFGCAKFTIFVNTSSNQYPYWYCTECNNGRDTKYPELIRYNYTILTYTHLFEKPWKHK